ncbi:MAG: peptidoglycan DD-metalloendopeptidase family protein [Deferribacteraceae bacterium]|jgi:septal ring factor EnvC (AmiA/AmiB activator)|nr:peptidoglycan DD-metalloendopeptidase family protein [Deferribacteraceae bacterium]
MRLLLSIFLLCASISAYAANDDALSKLRSQIKAQEQELRTLETGRASLTRQIEAIQKNQSDIRAAAALSLRQIEQNQAKLSSLQAEERALAAKIEQYQAHGQAALRFMMDNSGTLTARAVLGGAQAGESMQMAATMEIISRLNINLLAAVRNYAQAMERITAIKAGIAAENSLLEANRKANEELSAGLKNSVSSLNTKLAAVKQDQRAQQDYLAKLKSEQQRLSGAIKERTIKMTSSAFAQNRGKLPYPMVGSITEGFGERLVPEAGVRVMHNGIKITPATNGRVSAVFAGTVVYIDYISGLGNLLIIQHDDTYYTVYSNLDEFYVKTMQKVAAGEQLGSIDLALAGRPQLYFEIRQHDKAINPAGWLRR